jgi:antitoxin component YwqK of YwqJK toxin-antitoxin module
MKAFISVLIIGFLYSCSPTTENVSGTSDNVILVDTIRKPITFDKLNKPMSFELYTRKSGVETIIGFEEVFGSGKLKIRGKYNTSKQRIGVWEAFYESGIRWSVGEYKNGVEHGIKNVWYPNGKMRFQGQYTNGNASGVWEIFDEEGKMTRKVYE